MKLVALFLFFMSTLSRHFGTNSIFIRYVPLVRPFQMALVPLLGLVFLATAINIRAGISVFVFLFPLVNGLPYFFGIHENIPHAPAALVLALAFFLGWFIHQAIRPESYSLTHPFFRPVLIFSCIVFVSGVITFARFMNFFPFAADRFRDLVVNVNEAVRPWMPALTSLSAATEGSSAGPCSYPAGGPQLSFIQDSSKKGSTR
ncbi:MAG: hypothetical protein ACE5LV_08040 [Candidatus Aminicenantales bacterium]